MRQRRGISSIAEFTLLLGTLFRAPRDPDMERDRRDHGSPAPPSVPQAASGSRITCCLWDESRSGYEPAGDRGENDGRWDAPCLQNDRAPTGLLRLGAIRCGLVRAAACSAACLAARLVCVSRRVDECRCVSTPRPRGFSVPSYHIYIARGKLTVFDMYTFRSRPTASASASASAS